jgi:hypothetical protein
LVKKKDKVEKIKESEKKDFLDSKKELDEKIEMKEKNESDKKPEEGEEPLEIGKEPDKKTRAEENDEIGKKEPKKKPEEEDNFLETDVDKLYQIVKNENFIKISDAAKRFNLPKEKIEEWGNILESHELIKMHYPAFGEPILILKAKKTKRAGAEKHRKKFSKKRVVIPILLVLIFAFVFLYRDKLSNPEAIFSSINSEIQKFISSSQIGNQFYLILPVIIIVVVIVILKFKWKQIKMWLWFKFKM